MIVVQAGCMITFIESGRDVADNVHLSEDGRYKGRSASIQLLSECPYYLLFILTQGNFPWLTTTYSHYSHSTKALKESPSKYSVIVNNKQTFMERVGVKDSSKTNNNIIATWAFAALEKSSLILYEHTNVARIYSVNLHESLTQVNQDTG